MKSIREYINILEDISQDESIDQKPSKSIEDIEKRMSEIKARLTYYERVEGGGNALSPGERKIRASLRAELRDLKSARAKLKKPTQEAVMSPDEFLAGRRTKDIGQMDSDELQKQKELSKRMKGPGSGTFRKMVRREIGSRKNIISK